MSAKVRAIKGTNIEVRAVRARPEDCEDFTQRTVGLLKAIDADDHNEVMWLKTLRPEKSLIHPAEAFLQGIKKLRPALHFNTFDMKKASTRRAARREKERRVALRRKSARMAPTVAMKAINLKKTPRTGGHATDEEVRFLSRGKANKRALDHIAAFQKKKAKSKHTEAGLMGATRKKVDWKKKRIEKIGSKI